MFRRSSKRSSSRSGDDDVSVLSTTSSVKSSNSFLSIRSLPVTSRDESAVFNPLRLGRRNKGQSRPRNKNRLLAGRKDLPHAEIVVTTTTTKQKSAKDARADDLARMFEKYEEIAGQEEEDDYDVCSTVSGASRGAYSVMSNGGDYSSASAMSARERMIANSLKAQQQRFASVSSQSEAGGVARDRMRVRKAQQQQQQLAQPPSKPGNASALQVFLAREEEKAKQSQRNLRYQQDYGDVDIRSTSSYGGKSSHVDRSSAMRRGSSNGKSKNAVEKFGKRRSLDLVTGQLQPQRQTKLYSASGLPEERGVNMNGPKDGNRTPHLLRLRTRG
uniref:Uncharacterized protein n=1 Tax=Entomoneis paludosa TaxID=265537 RepID=A0A7S2YPU0_9STRA|mmetsp:Transcript_4924/g.10437  ORF Transcript_4924/g.10437 Transcript_4924/m.10437 type:complete len:330 (+) Transcript_4924:41-1030(+)